MLWPYFYLTLFFICLLLGVILCVVFLLLLYSAFKGAPYVATRKKDIQSILGPAKLKRGQNFLEIGCGDGRIVRYAVQNYGVYGVGMDVNLVFVYWARLKALLQGINDSHLKFRKGNVMNFSFKDVDIIYMFLLPNLIERFYKRIEEGINRDVLVISHGFIISAWADKLIFKRTAKDFHSYYYKVSKKIDNNETLI
jgi:SAM-dependent methyltransferase